MAKRQTRKQRAASMKNLRKAWAKNRKKGGKRKRRR